MRTMGPKRSKNKIEQYARWLEIFLILLPLFYLVGFGVAGAQDLPDGAPLLVPSQNPPETVLRLNTGEWLRGRLEYMNYGRIHFNSRKLDRVNFEWNDVHYLRTTEAAEYHLRGERKLRGVAWADREKVYLSVDGGAEQVFDRETILAIYTGEAGIRNARWFGSVTGSYDTSSGNSDEVSYDFSANVTRRAGSLETIFKVNSSFAEQDSNEIRRKHSLTTQNNYDLKDWFYVTFLRTETTYDKFQNIDLRLRGSVGVGFNLIRTNDLNWRIEGGPGLEHTEFREAAPGADDDESGAGFALAMYYDQKISERLDFNVDYIAFVSAENSDDATHELKTVLSFELISDFDLDFTLTIDRNENPQRGNDGVLPDRDDVRFLIGVSWDF